MTHKAYQKSKIDLFERVMLDANPSIGLAKEAGKVLKGMDLGCGSGWAKQLMGERMHAEFTGVDLEHEDKTKWAGNEGKAHVGEEDVVHYDGVHLIEAMEGDTKGYTQLYDMITYNYVLHHYPDRDAQVKGLQKAAALLKEGGVMMFSEHATLLSDPQIELQHVFFDLKKVPTEKRKHGDEANYVKEYEQEKGKAAYFSRELLFAVAKECGLKPIVVRPRLGGMDHKEEYDASQAVMIGFVRTEKTLTPGELRRFVPKSQSELNVKALEAEDVSKLDVKWVSGDSDVAGKKVPLSIQTASFFEASSDLRKSADGRLERSDFFAEQRKEKAGAAGASGSSSANKDEANPDKPKGP